MAWRDTFGRLARTVESVFPSEKDLDRLFAAKRPLRVKLGLDLTSTTVTIGNEIPLRVLGRFQELGHTAVLILGDFTALVGDPSGKDKTRPILTAEQVARNGATWLNQIGKVFDVSRAEVRKNSEWLGKLGPAEIVRLAGQLTVAQMLERDSFAKRYAEGAPIHLHEFLYCVFQAYDSVVVKSDVELGGTDQTFNLNVGRTLQKFAEQPSQVCVINTLLEGIDGSAKMSKSLGNAIGIDTPRKDMFGLATRVPDALVGKYFRLATDVADGEIDRLLAGDIWSAKKTMAEALVARHYGAEAARAEREEFERVFRDRELPEDIPEHGIGARAEWTATTLVRTVFAMSGGEARRLIEQGAVTLEAERLSDPLAAVKPRDGQVLRAGKRKFARLRLR
ncbi:MAG TPA: tyrosine--tRNA ligase [Planctomycetota bacterium]|nr:tyrosine--tRNA ligase [Planctomycetota bacterium]